MCVVCVRREGKAVDVGERDDGGRWHGSGAPSYTQGGWQSADGVADRAD